MISNIAKITVYVKNSAEAKKFWTENMGFVIREEQLMGPGMTWLETAPDYHAQTTIVLFERSRMEKPIRRYLQHIRLLCLPVRTLKRSIAVY